MSEESVQISAGGGAGPARRTRRQPVLRDNYRPPPWLVDDVELTFELDPHATRVQSRLHVRRNPDVAGSAPLRLDGQSLMLERASVDGRELTGNEYRLEDGQLTLFDVNDRAVVEIVTRIDPAANSALEGLYVSGEMYCTQCEAEGFRRITYFPDRPDVMARYRTTIVADAERYPVMLSNGDEVARRAIGDGRIAVTWEDPFPKPSYLFALVAGDLECIEDQFVTASGRAVRLRIYTEAHNLDKCAFAMDALKRAMRWDEDKFGREYDLDTFMIVAVDHFNMGAMENKGLNIFNASCVLAAPDTTTDAGYRRIEGVVAHEYFHNWSGNRVTCRDWFQLSLKEGFTVLRDAMFSADQGSPTLKRIEDVEFLRTVQFAEDAGALAHPVRPDAYLEISNFYTATVYEKGAEVVRMMATMLGPDRFRAGCDLYFERHDGQAVTVEDFVKALEDASGVSLDQFRLWYSQAGTPRVTVHRSHDPATGTLNLTFEQSCPPTPEQPDKAPLHIPLAFALIGKDGQEIGDLETRGDVVLERPGSGNTWIAHLKSARQRLAIENLETEPALSLLRGFSAPVHLEVERTPAELAFLASHDSDGFCRWDAAQTLFARAILAAAQGAPDEHTELAEALAMRLLDASEDAPDDGEARAALAATLRLPTLDYLGELQAAAGRPIHFDPLHQARTALALRLAGGLEERWRRVHAATRAVAGYVPTGAEMARRSLNALALAQLALTATDAPGLVAAHYHRADNITDRLAALRAAIDVERADMTALGEQLLEAFYSRFEDDTLAIDQWFSAQAASPVIGTAARTRSLLAHPAFDWRNPNRVRSLIGAFSLRNPLRFHAADGTGYALLADAVMRLDDINPQIAARLLQPLARWRRFDAAHQAPMREALEAVGARKALSADVYEIVSKSLAGQP